MILTALILPTLAMADPPTVSPRAEALDLLVLTGGKPARLELQVEVDGKPVPSIWDETFAKLFAFHDRDENGSLDTIEAARLPSSFALRQVLWGQFVTFAGDAPPFAELDLNADGKVSRDELADNYRRCGLGGVLVGIGKPTATKPLSDAMPFIVLPLRIADTQRITAVTARREKENAPPISTESLIALRTSPPAAAWQIQLGARNSETDQVPLQVVGEKPPANARLTFSTERLHIELRTDDGKLREQTAAARKRFTALFAECDTNSDGTLDEKELATPRAGQAMQLATIADRNSDGRLTEPEFTAWLDLQEQIAKGHVLLTLLDRETGLFESLDADHDGSLSTRELHTAWGRLKSAGCVINGLFDQSKLPHYFLGTVSHGHP